MSHCWNTGFRGASVCGETTLVISNSVVQHFEWQRFGLKIHTHEHCLPRGMEQCIVSIKVSLTGQYEFPENSHLVSAVFWFQCKPPCKFMKPITIEIQHCATSENFADLSFVKASCTPKQLPYMFNQLHEGSFSRHTSYGVLELNSFSGLAVTQKGSMDREYSARLFYSTHQPENPTTIDFVVTWNTKAHINVSAFISSHEHINL